MRNVIASAAFAALAGAVGVSAPASADEVRLRFTIGDAGSGFVLTSGGGHHSGHHGHGYGGHAYELSFHQVRHILRDRGFSRIRLERERRHVYVVSAVGRRGADVRVRVNKYSGQILDIERLGPAALSAYQAADILRDRGYRRLRLVSQNRHAFVYHATGVRGRRVAVRVDRFSYDVQRLGFV